MEKAMATEVPSPATPRPEELVATTTELSAEVTAAEVVRHQETTEPPRTVTKNTEIVTESPEVDSTTVIATSISTS
jgi:hypothetical protein